MKQGVSLILSLGGEEYSCELGSNKFYMLCGFGGIISCGLTHTAVVPLDLVKCRMQVMKLSQSIKVCQWHVTKMSPFEGRELKNTAHK